MALEDKELVKIVAEKLDRALNAADGGISQRRRDLFDRYLGAREGDERPGYSSFTTREVLEAVEWAMPALIRIFTAGKKVVSFDPVGAEDEDAAEQETDIINHMVMKSNGGDGFLALYSFIKDCLINPTGYAKVYTDTQDMVITHKATSLLAQDLATIEGKENVTIVKQDSRTIQIPLPGPDGIEIDTPVEVFDIKYQERDERPRLKVIPVPGEEVLVDNEFTSLDLDNCAFVAHRVRKHRSELLRMGYDADDLDMVGDSLEDDAEWNDERTHRLFYEDEHPDDEENEPDPSMTTYWVHEVWMWVDYDEDGESEYRRLVIIGSHVFENEECDYQPMVAMSSSIIPHKHTGLSLAEMVEDLQRLLTVLTRQLLDNTYRTNTNRKFFSEDALLEDGESMEAMLDPTAEWIPVRGDARLAVYPEQPQSIVDQLLPVIQHAQAATSMRTGVAPENNVDPHVLQQSTYGAFMGAMEKAGERIELIARIMAETGIKQIFRKAHALCRAYPDIANAVKLRGEWIPVDATSWMKRTDLTANVGLGFNDKRQMVESLFGLFGIQKEAMPMGLVQPQHIYNTMNKIADAVDVGASDMFFISPEDPDFQPPNQEPPAQEKLFAAQAQAVMMEQQRKMQEMQVQAQIDQKKLELEELKIKIESEIKQREAQMNAAKSEQDMQLKMQEFELRLAEAEQKGIDAEADRDIKMQELNAKSTEAEMKYAEMSGKQTMEMAQIEQTEASTVLAKAQAIKTLADADKTSVEAEALAGEAEESLGQYPEVEGDLSNFPSGDNA